MSFGKQAMRKDWIAILDFGSQYTHLIARRIREYKVYSEIVAHDISAVHLARRAPTAIILSGGPASVTAKNAPLCDVDIFALNIPILGICYGAQLMAKVLGGSVAKAKAREYGKATLSVKSKATLFKGLNAKETVWMSHGDRITRMPQGFHIIGSSGNSPIAAMENEKYHFYGVQFHPEVLHTPKGKTIVQNFLTSARCRPTWNMRSFIKESVRDVRSRIGKERVLCALSGGVDSSVLTMLLHKAIGKNLIAIFIDNGVLRKDEAAIVKERFKKQFHINLKTVDARNVFLKALKGIRDPERKRKVIGRTFIEVFEREAKKLGTMPFLAQGTLYPDVIESSSAFGGPSATIKTHHNVGGLPKNLKFTLIEPLRYLFKDEVRMLGKELGLPDELVYWQSFCVLLPIKTVGVMGDERTYENVIAVRAVTSEDAMTAHWAKLPYELLETVSNRIINEVKGINRVVYDISSKPPSTIEWE
jgi:GMP synthase (glutamine-hydrolysing)